MVQTHFLSAKLSRFCLRLGCIVHLRLLVCRSNLANPFPPPTKPRAARSFTTHLSDMRTPMIVHRTMYR